MVQSGPTNSGVTIRCRHCGTTVVHDRRNNAGCNCDPDAPQWCYIQPDGKIRGFSQAAWDVIATDVSTTDIDCA